MERSLFSKRNFIISSISVILIGGTATLYQYNNNTPQKKQALAIQGLNIVNCWQYIPSTTKIRCKKELDSCDATWTEGYPPHPNVCP